MTFQSVVLQCSKEEKNGRTESKLERTISIGTKKCVWGGDVCVCVFCQLKKDVKLQIQEKTEIITAEKGYKRTSTMIFRAAQVNVKKRKRKNGQRKSKQ